MEQPSVTFDMWKRSPRDVQIICNVFHWRVKEVFLLHKGRIQGEIWNPKLGRRGWMIAVDDETHLNNVIASLRKLKEDGIDLAAPEP